VPDDPHFAEQWALRNTGSTGGQPGADIQAVPAWATTTGAPTTVIAVIDSGADFTHPDLQNNQWTNTAESSDGNDNDNNGLVDDLHGWDWISGGSVIDEQGHGTIVAGIIAAQGNNGVGMSGVMWRAALMSLRVLDNTGTGSVADAVEAMDYAADHGALVINCSWGTDEESIALKDAIQRAGTRGVVWWSPGPATTAGTSRHSLTTPRPLASLNSFPPPRPTASTTSPRGRTTAARMSPLPLRAWAF
jgi:subtilisin family serine protease